MTSLSSTRASSQDVPTNSLGKLHSGAEVHLKCAGAYVTLDSEETYLKWDVTAGAGTSGAEPGASAAASVTAIAARPGYTRNMAFRLLRRQTSAPGANLRRRAAGASADAGDDESASTTDFVIQSVSTGKYVTVGGMFRGYCLMATADSADEACSFSYVLPGRRLRLPSMLTPGAAASAVADPEAGSSEAASGNASESTRERRAAALLFSIFVSEGVGAGRQGIVSIRKDGYLTVVDPPKALTAPLLPEDFESTADGPHNERTATPGVAAAASGGDPSTPASLAAGAEAWPEMTLLAMECLVPLTCVAPPRQRARAARARAPTTASRETWRCRAPPGITS